MIPIEILVLVFISFVIFLGSVIYAIGGKEVLDETIARLRGKNYAKIEKTGDIKPAEQNCEVSYIEFEKPNGEIIRYHGRQDLSNNEFVLLSYNGTPIEKIKLDECIVTNLRDILDNKTDFIRVKLINNNAYEHLNAQLRAKDLQILQMRQEYERLSRAFTELRVKVKEAENREYRAKYKGLPMRPPIRFKGKEETVGGEYMPPIMEEEGE